MARSFRESLPESQAKTAATTYWITSITCRLLPLFALTSIFSVGEKEVLGRGEGV